MGLGNLKALIGNYIPSDQVIERKQKMFGTLVDLLAREDIHPSTRSPIVDEIFGFIEGDEQVKLAIEWLQSGKLFKQGQANSPLFELN